MSTPPPKCGAEVHRAGKPTGELCSKPAGHKSAHSSWWPNKEPSQTRVQIRRVGGYNPALGPKHPDNQDPTLPPAKVELMAFATAPRDATEILAWTTDRYGNRRWLVVHWAQGGGEEQPPFRGWFYNLHDGYAEIDPKHILGWLALPARAQVVEL